MQCCIAQPLGEGRRSEARYHPSGESAFHPPKRTTVPPLKGTYRYARQLFDKNGPLQSLPTKLLNHPDPLQMWQNL